MNRIYIEKVNNHHFSVYLEKTFTKRSIFGRKKLKSEKILLKNIEGDGQADMVWFGSNVRHKSETGIWLSLDRFSYIWKNNKRIHSKLAQIEAIVIEYMNSYPAMEEMIKEIIQETEFSKRMELQKQREKYQRFIETPENLKGSLSVVENDD